MAQQRNRNYNLIVRAQGEGDLKKLETQLNRTNKRLKNIDKNSKNLALGFNGLQAGILAFTSALSVTELARFSDEIQLLDNRLAVFADEGQTSIQLLDGLNEVAKRTRGDIIALGESYNRIAINVKDLGFTSAETLDITQALNQTFRLSGSSIAEARGATIQFTQGLAQAELRGQELRSVLEANAVFGGLLADKLGVTRGELLKLGEAGKITSEVALSALIDNFDELNKQAEGLLPTFEQGFIRLLNESRLTINKLNKELELSASFADGIEVLAGNLGAVFGALAGAAAVAAIGSIALFVTTVGALPAAIGAAVVGLGALGGAIVQSSAEAKEAATSLDLIAQKTSEIDKINRYLDNGATGNFRERLEARREIIDKEIMLLNEERLLENSRLAIAEADAKRERDKQKELDRIASLKGLEKLNYQLLKNIITLEEYENQVAQFEANKLIEEFDKGKISFDEYNQSIDKIIINLQKLQDETDSSTFGESLKTGFEKYSKSAGTFGENVSGAVENAFNGAEDTLVDFVRNGKASFKDFANSIIDDLVRIAIRQAIIRPLGQALFSEDGNIFSGGQVVPSANGNVFSGGNVQAFATGGVVSGTTAFPITGGKTGIMGEAGPEGIVPLERVNGKLGVNASGIGSNVQVNIINQNGSNIETQESTDSSGQRILDVLIKKKVSEGFANGSFDKTMKGRYNLRPQGI